MRIPKFVTAFPAAAWRYGPKFLLIGGGMVMVGIVIFEKMMPSTQALTPPATTSTKPVAGGLGIEEARKRDQLLEEQKEDARLRQLVPKLSTMVEKLENALTQKDQDQRKETTALREKVTGLEQQVQAQKNSPPPRTAAPGEGRVPPPAPPKQEPRRTPTDGAPTLPQLGAKLYLFKPSETAPRGMRTPRANHLQTAHIPWWSFAPVRVVFGGLASSRENSAVPILLALTGEFTAPSQLQGPGRNPLKTALEIQGCFAGGYAGGDLAASRVKGRLVALSCVFPSGESFEQPIDGYLVGEDGREGVYAQVEHHASAQEAKAFVLGLFQEASAALGLARSKVVVTSVTGAPQPFQGTQNMLQELGRFYLQQMSYLLPTLTLDANTPAWLVLKEGVTLEGLPVTVQTVQMERKAWPSY